ncbi:DNA polymerase III subunit delta [Acidimangrovimonas sediminis]|uniref:DNA polymerase III subunit delta n=1 Tax=Acidimangrovimonas sediminis TaxID=2056283 RepID=UPI000C800977|nr:DNA polymerase III subunit delta [Acidimangrovimonas sediminis]
MKLSGAEASRYIARPDPRRAGLLLFGADAMRVALKRQEAIAALIGPEGEAEMRLTRIPAADLRKDGALLIDAVKAQGFFPGPRVAFVEEAGDGLAPVISAALAEWREGDAAIVVTAGQLNARSALRKAFEGHASAYAVGIYDDPPGREEIEAALAKAGLAQVDREAMTDLMALARTLDPGDFRQTVEKIGLYKHGDTTPLTVAEVALSAPQSTEAGVDAVIDIVAEGRQQELGPMLSRLEGQGVAPVTLCIMTLRHFRALHSAGADPAGPAQGLARLRPPVFGPRRDRMQRQLRQWNVMKAETALGILVETDLQLRSSSRAPARAVMERSLIRLAMLAQR